MLAGLTHQENQADRGAAVRRGRTVRGPEGGLVLLVRSSPARRRGFVAVVASPAEMRATVVGSAWRDGGHAESAAQGMAAAVVVLIFIGAFLGALPGGLRRRRYNPALHPIRQVRGFAERDYNPCCCLHSEHRTRCAAMYGGRASSGG